MRIYPAIDLWQGNCVRLTQGKFETATHYCTSPLEMAHLFESCGFKHLHVVDLEGAKQGRLEQTFILEQLLKETKLALQVGGGVRTEDDLEWLLKMGAERVVIGSLAVTSKATVKRWLQEYGVSKIVLALDVIIDAEKNPLIAVHGWQHSTVVSLWSCLEYFSEFENLQILCTDISKDGCLFGPNLQLYREATERFSQLNFIVSGGIRAQEDVVDLQSMAKISGVIIGRAIYEGKIDLKELARVN